MERFTLSVKLNGSASVFLSAADGVVAVFETTSFRLKTGS
jgi:hypothetical protein